MIKKIIRKLCKCIMYFPRKIYYIKMRRKLKNSNFTIISNNCFGTFVYSNLNHRFDSPTINLFFTSDDFLHFAANLKGYLSASLIEVREHDRSYPVGELTYNGKAIRVYFMHYSSFEQAYNKWNERKKRVNYSNIFIIQTIAGDINAEFLNAFQKLPFDNKLLITKENDFVCDCMVTHPIFSSKKYRHGKFFHYKSWLSCKRYMDEIDYVGFLDNNIKHN